MDRRAEPIKSGHYFGLSLAIGPKGDLFIAVKGRGTVEKLNADATLTVVAGKAGDKRFVDGAAAVARLKAPNAIAIDDRGVIYVADTRTIRKIGLDGKIVTLAGDPRPVSGGEPAMQDGQGSDAAFLGPTALAIDQKGNIYVADSYDGEDDNGQSVTRGVVRKVSPSGRVGFVGLNTTFQYISGIAIDASGNLFVTERYPPMSLYKIDVNLDVTTLTTPTIGSYMSTGLAWPTAITIDGSQALFVVSDPAMDFPSMRNWLHRIVGNKLTTLCGDKGPSR